MYKYAKVLFKQICAMKLFISFQMAIRFVSVLGEVYNFYTKFPHKKLYKIDHSSESFISALMEMGVTFPSNPVVFPSKTFQRMLRLNCC